MFLCLALCKQYVGNNGLYHINLLRLEQIYFLDKIFTEFASILNAYFNLYVHRVLIKFCLLITTISLFPSSVFVLKMHILSK
jgi:hypothetical protein